MIQLRFLYKSIFSIIYYKYVETMANRLRSLFTLCVFIYLDSRRKQNGKIDHIISTMAHFSMYEAVYMRNGSVLKNQI